MEKNVALKNGGSQPISADEMLKATALLYFQDALYAEKYESCLELIQAAKNYGALPSDISKIIAQFVKRLQGNSQSGANQPIRRALGGSPGLAQG